jgi:hypothetical protein
MNKFEEVNFIREQPKPETPEYLIIELQKQITAQNELIEMLGEALFNPVSNDHDAMEARIKVGDAFTLWKKENGK